MYQTFFIYNNFVLISNFERFLEAERFSQPLTAISFNRVDGIDDTMTPRSTFERNEKGQIVKITYIDYYKKNYGIDIMDWDQPMLISRYIWILKTLY